MMHYVYAHIKITTGEVFYIGKGCGKRMLSKQNRSKYWHNIVNKHDYDYILLDDNLTEDQANSLEKYWINRLGRKDLKTGCLINFTDGGEGSCGRIVEEHVKLAVAAANKLRIVSDKQKETYRNLWKGKTGKLHNRSKTVICIKDGKKYGSMSEAERFYGLGQGSVSWSIKNKRPIFGMHFEIKS